MRQGVHKITHQEYHADPCPVASLSCGVAKDLLFKSPRHAWHGHRKLNPDYREKEDTKFDIGTAWHAMLFEGASSVAIVEAADWRTKVAKESRDAARAEGKTPLLEVQYYTIKKMVKLAIEVLADSELDIKDLGSEGDAELSYIWQEAETWLKVRPDWISKDRAIILDGKTTSGSANPNDLSRTIISLGYDIQDALYRRGVKAIEGVAPRFFFLFQETEAPYVCSIVSLSPQFQHLGEMKVQQAIDLWRYCMENNDWSGYPKRIAYLDMPPWAESWVVNSTFISSQEEGL